MSYSEFISSKAITAINSSFEADPSLFPETIKPHQAATIKWACARGRSAAFLDTGLGKTLVQLAWCQQVCVATDGYCIIVTPLAVAHQTIREAAKFGIAATFAAVESDITDPGIYVTNYEKLHHFDLGIFQGVALDESSILKGMDGKFRRMLTDGFALTPFKLSCTATPSPNDFMELGTQSEFLGIMSQVEMLAQFFIHDGGDTSKWRLKGHGKTRFWEWLATWALFMRSPADLGFDAEGYDLPPIEYHNYVIETEATDQLFVEPAMSLMERNQARRGTVEARCHQAAEIANALDEPCVVWCNLNDESEMLAKLIDGSVEVKGSDKPEHKISALLDFSDAKIKCLVSKPKIAGHGMNWQTTRHCIFVGLSDSWEAFYQAVRRQWRFGQTETVHCHIISADIEGAVIENIRRKDLLHKEMSESMMKYMADHSRQAIFGATQEKTDYLPAEVIQIPAWLAS